MLKKIIWTAVLLFLGSAVVSGIWSSSPVIALIVAIGFLLLLGRIWKIGKRKKTKDKEPASAAPSEPDPETVDYPFTNLGMAKAADPCDYIVFDTETTGFSPREDKIIELAAIKIQNGSVTRFHSLVNPGRRIPKRSQAVHKITDADVTDAPTFSQILPAFDAFLDPELPIVGQNVLFDLRILWWEYHDAGREIAPRSFIDTYKMAKKAFPGRDSYSLESLIHDYKLIDGEQSHRSESDADATMALYRLCCEKLKSGK